MSSPDYFVAAAQQRQSVSHRPMLIAAMEKREAKYTQMMPPPFTINVQVDGETIAKASHDAEKDSASRAFSPVPVY